jgi:carbonic anhydrase
MIEVVWRYDPDAPPPPPPPATAEDARRVLTAGNRAFAELFDARRDGPRRQVLVWSASEVGGADQDRGAVRQRAFAAVLSCSDARVPPEMVLGQKSNDLFVVRVAGNVPGTECMGSLDFAVHNLASLRLVVVLGHTSCGAVTAAVDGFLRLASYVGVAANLPLRTIVDSLMAEVHGAAAALEHVYGTRATGLPGYRSALIELTAVMNAAVTAAVTRHTFSDHLTGDFDVLYGVYNLENRFVGLPGGSTGEDGWSVGFAHAPDHAEGFVELSHRMAQSMFIDQRLHGKG